MSRQAEIEVEKKIVRCVVEDLLAAGFQVGVNNGEERCLKRSSDINEIIAATFSTDEDWLIACKNGKYIGWVRCIWGNEEDIISDYTTNLESCIRRSNELADSYA